MSQLMSLFPLQWCFGDKANALSAVDLKRFGEGGLDSHFLSLVGLDGRHNMHF